MIMKKIYFLLVFLLYLLSGCKQAPVSNDIVIKGGHVIDPKNDINSVMDIAVRDGKIFRVAENIDTAGARQVVNAAGLYVTPGLIDIHVHVFQGPNLNQAYSNGPSSITPDGFTFRVGVTTVVDAGCAGTRNFDIFKKQIIDISQTRVLAFLNIVAEGMRGGPFEQNIKDMNAQRSAEFAKRNPEIVGIKLAHYSGRDWTPVKLAEEAAALADIPLMVDFGSARPALSLDTLFNQVFRPGDIFTHAYAELGESRESIVDTSTREVKPFVWEAQKRGIVFDVGYGGISLAYSQAIPAVKSGFLPQAISTDLHIGSMNGAMKDMLNCMSKFLAMGMDLPGVIRASTWQPAQIIKRED